MKLLLKDRLVLACDVPSVSIRGASSEASKLITKMSGRVGWIKLNSAFVGGGHDLALQVKEYSSLLWLDLKWHDVAGTVKNYAREVAELCHMPLHVNMVTVHSAGGKG